jgi:uncharacterized lipoprotein YddW (UPF0748 family)
MKRRRFLKTLGGGVVGAGLLPTALVQGCGGGEDPSPDDFTVWAWVHGGADRTPEEWLVRFRQLRESGFHAVLVSGGDTAVLSTAAHSAGLEFHRWMWILNRNGDRWAMENHPEWFTVNRNGDSTLDVPPYVGYYRWVCPTRGPVREYLNGLIGEVAADERVDGVHLDYIRHSDVILPRGLWEKYDLIQDVEHPEFDYCYCDVCRGAFDAERGVDPMTLDDPPANQAWVRFRWDSVTRLVTELAETVHSYDKPISAAVFPGPSVARRLVRQSWDEWPVDMLFPMLYHSFYIEDLEWIGAMVTEGVSAVQHSGATLRSGLYLPDLTPGQLTDAIRISRNAGAAGVSTFEMNGLTDEHLAVIRAAST